MAASARSGLCSQTGVVGASLALESGESPGCVKAAALADSAALLC